MIKIPFFKNIKFTKNDKNIITEFAEAKNAADYYKCLGKLPNPDPILRKSGKGLSTLRDLKANYQVGTCIESRKAGVTCKNWQIEKNDCSDKEFDFWNEIFKFIDIYALIEDILETPLFGYVPIEILYQKDSGYIYPEKLIAKPQEWFYFKDNEFYFNSRSDGGIKIDFVNPKFIIPRHRASFLNPYGECLLSRCFWNVAFINGGMEFWGRFMEKYGMPFAIGKYDRSMNDNEKKDLFFTLKKMVQDAIAVIPSDGSVELIEPADKSGSSEVYNSFINKCEKNIAKVILGQTLTTDIGSSGSYAASNTHQQVREDLILSDVRLCEKTINEFIFKVHTLNFNNTNCPEIIFYDEEKIDCSRAERDNKVKTLGVNFTKKYIKNAYGYEEDDFELSEHNNNTILDFSDSIDDDISQLENVVSNFSHDDVEKMINPCLNPVLELFKKSKNAEETMEMIAEIYPDMNTAELEKTLTKIIFLAELLGRIK